jgi:hypothetical protein
MQNAMGSAGPSFHRRDWSSLFAWRHRDVWNIGDCLALSNPDVDPIVATAEPLSKARVSSARPPMYYHAECGVCQLRIDYGARYGVLA